MTQLFPLLYILLINVLVLKAVVTETRECNTNAPVCGKNVTQKVCEDRNCCYNPSPNKAEKCFKISGHTFAPYNSEVENIAPPANKVGELLPNDGVQLPEELESRIMQLGNLTKAQAIEAVNSLETYLKNTTLKEDSSVDWEYEIEGAFSAFVKVTSESVFQPIIFNSGTEIQIDNRSGSLGNGTTRNISRAIIVEYPTLITVFKKDQERRRINCKVSDKYLDDSPIISITAFDSNWNKLSVPVTYTVKGLNTSKPVQAEKMGADLSCKYLNESVERWLSAGCTVAAVQNSIMTCSCNHTTKFSMLFVIYPMTLNISADHISNIQTLEYVMESLSLTCLVATIGVLWLVQRRRSRASSVSSMRAGERTAVHVNFVAALACLHLVRLLSDFAQQYDMLCAAVVVLSHYFMLSSGMWMLIEGLLLYLNVIVRSMKNTALGIHKYWTGWGIPAVIVLISAAIGFVRESYIELEETDVCQVDNVKISAISNHYKTCWLSTKSYMIWAATGPLIVIFAVNIFILAHTVIFVWRLNRKTGAMKPSNYSRDNGQYFWKTAKSILVLFPILGVPWLIGFMINIEHTLVNIIFQYLHVILNGLQGFFIFILYCIINKESRGIVTRVASTKWEQHKVSVSASNTLARSTSGGSRKDRSQRRRKSVSSNMGVSEQNPPIGTPVYTRRASNVKSIGSAASQFSVYTSSMNRKQSSGSGSTNVSGCAHRIHRIISTGSNEILRHKSIYYMKAGSSVSLPRLGKIEHYNKHMLRSGSVSSLNITGRQTRQTVETTYICKACKDMPCIHAESDVAGLTEEMHARESGDAVLLGYKTTSSLESLHAIETHQIPRRRMTAEEFKRFSAIPEEKRRSGINSFIAGDSNEYLSNRFSILSSLKVEGGEDLQEVHKMTVSVDVLKEHDSPEESDDAVDEDAVDLKVEEDKVPPDNEEDTRDGQVTILDDDTTVRYKTIGNDEPEMEAVTRLDEEEIDEKDTDKEETILAEKEGEKELKESENEQREEKEIDESEKLEAMERLRKEELQLKD